MKPKIKRPISDLSAAVFGYCAIGLLIFPPLLLVCWALVSYNERPEPAVKTSDVFFSADKAQVCAIVFFLAILFWIRMQTA